MKGQWFRTVTALAFRKGGWGWKVIMTSDTALWCSVSLVYTSFLKLFTTIGVSFDEDTLPWFTSLCGRVEWWAVLLSLARAYGIYKGKYLLHAYLKIRPTYLLQIHCSVTWRHLLGLIRKTKLLNSIYFMHKACQVCFITYVVVN